LPEVAVEAVPDEAGGVLQEFAHRDGGQRFGHGSAEVVAAVVQAQLTRSTSCRMAVAVKVLACEAIRNRCFVVSGSPLSTSAWPCAVERASAPS